MLKLFCQHINSSFVKSLRNSYFISQHIVWIVYFCFQYKIEKKADSDEEEDEDDDEFGAKKVEEVDDDPIMRKSWFISYLSIWTS